jgi:hypothetical protein
LSQLKAQFIGSMTCVICVTLFALLIMYLVHLTGTLRVSETGELEGIDMHEHGTHAYHMEFGQGVSYTQLVARTPSVKRKAKSEKDEAPAEVN